MTARWMALWAGAGVVLGAVLVGILRDGPQTAPAPVAGAPAVAVPGAGHDAELDALRDALAAQQTLTRALQAEVAQLRGEVERLSEDANGGGTETDGDSRATGVPAGRAWFDAEALLDQDVAPADVARLRERFEAHQLDILYLRDQAAREGWHNRPRFANEVGALRASLREELGEDGTDLLLWATGQWNRVELASVLGGSPALAAGLEGGDVVVRYDEARIFDGRALQEATRAGNPGELVPVDVMREGEELRFYVPRGPLGAQLRPVRRPPEPR